MTLSFSEFMGYILSSIHELLNIPIFETNLNGTDVSVTFGSVILFCVVVPVMYKLLFPSPS